MKHRTESRVPNPLVKYNSDQESLGGSRLPQYSSLLISQHAIYASSRPRLDPDSQDYFSASSYSTSEHSSGQMSYPESSQRTVVSGDTKPCSYTDEQDEVSADTRSPFLTLTNDAFHLPSTQERMLSPPVVANMYQQTESHDSHTVDTILRPVGDNFAHDRDSPRTLHSPLYLFPRKRTLEKIDFLDRYDSPAQLGSGVGTDSESYANFDADSPHDLGTPPVSSSIPMRNMGWSSASTPGNYDQTQVSEVRASVIQNSDSSVSACRPSEHLERNREPTPSSSSANETVKKKKSKMHRCEVCGKLFPRPSGLKTHMNTHNNLKPFPCGFEGCSRTFTVRSNAKRHLRTHGVETASSRQTSSTSYSVGFDTPTVLPPPSAPTHEIAMIPYKLRWMPPSLSTRTNAASLVSVSDDELSDDEFIPGLEDQYKSVLTLLCLPVVPSSSERDHQGPFEERNFYIEAPLYPYHPLQASFRTLSGPLIAPPADVAYFK